MDQQYQYDALCLRTFLEQQDRLYPENVAETEEEAADFLDMCMAVVCRDKKDLKRYLREVGADMAGLQPEELPEVFALPDGRYLVVEI